MLITAIPLSKDSVFLFLSKGNADEAFCNGSGCIIQEEQSTQTQKKTQQNFLEQTISYFASEQEIWEHYSQNPVAYNVASAMSPDWRQKLFDYLQGRKTLPLTYDPFFKRIFNADIHPERLADFLSAILGREVTIECILPSEDVMLDGGALLIMDILVRLSDGSLANVEIQKIPYKFSGERMSCYSADLLLREYSRVRGQTGSKFTYRDIKKVYTIVIFENTTKDFHERNLGNAYFHHGKTAFDTGLRLELLQEYFLISLDVFRNQKYTGDKKETNVKNEADRHSQSGGGHADKALEGWLSLLATESMEDVGSVLSDYPWLEEIYREMAEYLHRPEEVLYMFSEALKILDRNTEKLMMDEMMEEIAAMKEQVTTMSGEISAKDEQLTAQEKRIAELEGLLAEKEK